MKRHPDRILAAAIASSAVVAMITAPAAWAQDETGPDSAACAEMTAAYEAVAEPVGVPSDLEQQAQRTQAAVAAGETRMTELQAVIDENQAFLDAPETTESAKPYFQGQVNAAKVDLAEVEAAQVALVVDRDAAADALAVDQERFAGETQAKNAAEAAMGEACAEAPTPGVPGEPGAPGEPGVDGQDGSDGVNGVNGTDGVDGVDGQAGADGRDGVNGRDAAALRSTPNGGAELYENCAAARDAGAAPLYVTDDGYREDLDSDGDGVACEQDTLYNGSGEFSQTGDVPVGSAETGQA